MTESLCLEKLIPTCTSPEAQPTTPCQFTATYSLKEAFLQWSQIYKQPTRGTQDHLRSQEQEKGNNQMPPTRPPILQHQRVHEMQGLDTGATPTTHHSYTKAHAHGLVQFYTMY
ncbi:hypothetical protein J6590_014612 [Homalodisca vitripennis]|nr:hypothetical protein J6590_014612 [Homalodisca vitripennis]